MDNGGKYKKILLVDPKGGEDARGFNMGIASLSSVLRSKNKVVSILDFVNIRGGDPKEKIKKAVRDFNPDAVGVSIQNMSFRFSKEIIYFLRTIYPGLILIGGPEVTARKKILEEIPEADIAIIGEGEQTLPELLDRMEETEDISNIDGIVWRRGGRFVVNKPRNLIMDLDSMPFPDFETYGIKFFDNYPIMTSRGCPFNCSFCSSYLGRTWRKRSPENVITEIKLVVEKYKIKMIQFFDPSINIIPERVIKLCELMIQEKINIPWVAYGMRADKINDKLIKKMKEAGCKRVYVGIESMDPEVYAEIEKSESIEEIKRGIKIAKDNNVEVHGYLIMGLPKDNFKKTMRSFEEAEKLNLDALSWASAVPYTGTRLYEWVKNNAKELYDSTEVSLVGTRYEDVAFETKEFSYKERVLARKILRLKSGSYHCGLTTGKLQYWCEKLYLMFRYDWRSIPKRIVRSMKYRAKIKKANNISTILQNESVVLARIPDGTWGLNKNDALVANNELVLLKLK